MTTVARKRVENAMPAFLSFLLLTSMLLLSRSGDIISDVNSRITEVEAKRRLMLQKSSGKIMGWVAPLPLFGI